MATSDAPAPVLVVGAGPTGLTAACELLRRGVPVRLVDRAIEPTKHSKAIAVHARTLEIFDDLGVADALVERGNVIHGVNLWSGKQLLVSASFDELDTRYPFLLAVSQRDTEEILLGLLARLGGRVERETELVEIEQTGGAVTATFERYTGPPERARFDWVIGADGASSTVRKQIGLAFEGDTYDDGFLLADVKMTCALPRDRISTFFHPAGLLACFPMRGDRWRLICTAPEGEAILSARHEPPLADLQAIVDERADLHASLHDPVWLARFRIHCRQVKKYRSGRVLLAGDAAHIHSPAGGQGMNSGIQDAHNLAWKLALTVAGEAKPALLESYHDERHAIGASVLRGTDIATRVATLRNPIARAMRNAVGSFLASFEVIQQRIVRSTAELTVGYRGSPIVAEHHDSILFARIGGSAGADERPTIGAYREFSHGPRAGDRAPDATVHWPDDDSSVRLSRLIDGRRFTLLLFDGRAATAGGYERLVHVARAVKARWKERIVAIAVVPHGAPRDAFPDDVPVVVDEHGDAEHRYGASAECLYLVRPDLYVGYRSQPADETRLLAYLETLLA